MAANTHYRASKPVVIPGNITTTLLTNATASTLDPKAVAAGLPFHCCGVDYNPCEAPTREKRSTKLLPTVQLSGLRELCATPQRSKTPQYVAISMFVATALFGAYMLGGASARLQATDSCNRTVESCGR